MANDMGKLNQANVESDSDNNATGDMISDMANTNEDGGRNIVSILSNPNFKPSDLYHDSSNISSKTGLPVEAGNIVSNDYEIDNVNDIYKRRLDNYRAFDDNEGSLDFTHNLDRGFIPGPSTDSAGRVNYSNLNEIYLGSWYGTRNDNEDPIMFGYDIEIDVVNSPLFNGSIETFLTDNKYSDIDEVTSRLELLSEFKNQFYRFFKINISSEGNIIPNKIHYFKKIAGLDRLVNRVDSENFKGQFVEYSKEFIKLTLNEDVSLNMGYLASLYNALTWSKINGKRMIPDNLLRFNIRLTITEMRKFQRVLKENDFTFENLADKVSKHSYDLFECQFFFDKPYHNNEIDLSSPNIFNELEIKMNYKFYTHKFERFSFNPQRGRVSDSTVVNNRYNNPKEISSFDTNNINVNADGTRVLAPSEYTYTSLDKFMKGSENVSLADLSAAVAAGEISALEAMKIEEKRSNQGKAKTLFNKTIEDLINAGKREVNRRINKRTRLFNESMHKYRSLIPGGTGISEPTNVYSGQSQFESDVRNALGDFVGNSIKNLLGR